MSISRDCPRYFRILAFVHRDVEKKTNKLLQSNFVYMLNKEISALCKCNVNSWDDLPTVCLCNAHANIIHGGALREINRRNIKAAMKSSRIRVASSLGRACTCANVGTVSHGQSRITSRTRTFPPSVHGLYNTMHTLADRHNASICQAAVFRSWFVTVTCRLSLDNDRPPCNDSRFNRGNCRVNVASRYPPGR